MFSRQSDVIVLTIGVMIISSVSDITVVTTSLEILMMHRTTCLHYDLNECEFWDVTQKSRTASAHLGLGFRCTKDS